MLMSVKFEGYCASVSDSPNLRKPRYMDILYDEDKEYLRLKN